jgi:chitodextrinase
VYRDGALRAEVAGTGHVDATVAPGQTYTYEVAARDAAGNLSARSAPVTVTTPCDATLTSKAWNASKRELTVKATCTSAGAALRVLGDGTDLGAMTFQSGSYSFKKRLSARPACVTVTAACGDSEVSCF